MKLFCSNYWQNPYITTADHYFYYNSHHHYHYHCFHYHCKMQLYRLKVLITTPLYRNMIPSVSAKFCLLFTGLLAYWLLCLTFTELFVFYAQLKNSEFVYDHQPYFRCSVYTYIFIYSHLHFFIYTHLLYKKDFVKIDNMGNYDKIF